MWLVVTLLIKAVASIPDGRFATFTISFKIAVVCWLIVALLEIVISSDLISSGSVPDHAVNVLKSPGVCKNPTTPSALIIPAWINCSICYPLNSAKFKVKSYPCVPYKIL